MFAPCGPCALGKIFIYGPHSSFSSGRELSILFGAYLYGRESINRPFVFRYEKLYLASALGV